MIRYAYINNLVLRVYNTLEAIRYPLEPKEIIAYLPNCRYMSYQDFAKLNDCTLNSVIQICESYSGCTHYDIRQNRYLIMCNQSTANFNNEGRQRWTVAHEIGHVLCGHHKIHEYKKLAQNSLLRVENPEYETEADYFAAALLAPFPLFKTLHIQSASDVQKVFGLSTEASANRYGKYLRWQKTRRKTAWENDIVNLFLEKSV